MSHSLEPGFKGSGALLIRNVLLYLLATAPLLALCLMGAKWTHLLFGMTAVAVPLVLLVGSMVSRIDACVFNDAQGVLVVPFRRDIPYESILGIEINETGRLLQVSIKQGVLRRTPLLYALDIRDKERLTAELLQRFPRTIIRERTNADWKFIAGVMAIMFLLTAGYHGYLYQRDSGIRAVLGTVVWEGGAVLSSQEAEPYYTVERFQIAVPRQFRLTGKDAGGLLFDDRKAHIELQIVSGVRRELFGTRSKMLRMVTGIGDYYDVLDTAYSARFGIIPLALKKVLLQSLTNVNILEVRLGSDLVKDRTFGLYGFVTQGTKKSREVSTIFLTDATRTAEIHIVVTSPQPLEQRSLREITERVRLLP